MVGQPLPTLLPFAPVLRGGDSEQMVRRALEQLRREERLSDLEPLLAYFARFVLSTELVVQIMRWDMAVLRQSPWHQEIIAEGRAEGRAAALEEMRRLLVHEIVHTLEARLGPLPLDLEPHLAALPVEDLVHLTTTAAVATSLSDFTARLAARPGS